MRDLRELIGFGEKPAALGIGQLVLDAQHLQRELDPVATRLVDDRGAALSDHAEDRKLPDGGGRNRAHPVRLTAPLGYCIGIAYVPLSREPLDMVACWPWNST